MWIISSCPKGLWNISYLTKPRIITSNDFCPRLILSAIDYLPTNFTKIRKIRGQTIVHITCNLYTAKGVLPSRQNYCNSFFRGLRPRLLSLRSVVPSRHKRCMYINQFQDKTNPSLVTGLRCKLYTRNPFDYRLLCELVLG